MTSLPRQRSDFAHVHGPARKIEPGMSASIRAAFARIRDRVSIDALALRLSLKDQRGAVAMLTAGLDDELKTAGEIAASTVLRGGRIAGASMRTDQAKRGAR